MARPLLFLQIEEDLKKMPKVAVASRSFSKHELLRSELLQRYPLARFNDTGRTLEGNELVEFLSNYSRAIIGLEKITKEILDKLPELKVIAKYGVGLDGLDLQAMKDSQIHLGWTPGVNRRSVTELVLASAIIILRRISEANQSTHQGEWKQWTGNILSRKIIGIIGFGNIGRDLANVLRVLDCKILVNDILNLSEECLKAGATQVPLKNLLENSDLVTLHVPLNSTTLNLIGQKEIHLMQRGSFLINTSRGGIVNESALKEALRSGHLSAAALDVFCEEPILDRELLEIPNLFVTPHIGGSASEAILAMGRAAMDGLESAKEISFLDLKAPSDQKLP